MKVIISLFIIIAVTTLFCCRLPSKHQFPYQSEVYVEYCTGRFDTITIKHKYEHPSIRIQNQDVAVPFLYIEDGEEWPMNVCDFKLLNTIQI